MSTFSWVWYCYDGLIVLLDWDWGGILLATQSFRADMCIIHFLETYPRFMCYLRSSLFAPHPFLFVPSPSCLNLKICIYSFSFTPSIATRWCRSSIPWFPHAPTAQLPLAGLHAVNEPEAGCVGWIVSEPATSAFPYFLVSRH